ncbi:hypothetical protein WN48_01753 [Eufriesea mexicana]|uniref:Uncharacterized protein n=1 Tax=Eufriesea mexicana TaxID=516756 RepID=A0A310SR27_9HYME|nr:hypothetical protein WN48_01753 [Eufriesea mexicana]
MSRKLLSQFRQINAFLYYVKAVTAIKIKEPENPVYEWSSLTTLTQNVSKKLDIKFLIQKLVNFPFPCHLARRNLSSSGRREQAVNRPD